MHIRVQQGGDFVAVREKKIFPLPEGLTTADTYAVIGDAFKFQKHKHAWKVWRALKGFGCVVYPVAEDLKRIEGCKVYPDLEQLKDKVTVVVPCLLPAKLNSLISDTIVAGSTKIWFQQQTWTPELQQACDLAGIQVIKGCVLLHKEYSKISLCYLNPCYWHGLRDLKVPLKRFSRL